MALEETVRYEEQSPYKYVEGKEDVIMRTMKPCKKEGRDVSAKELKVEQETNRLDGWRGKVMHRQHVRQTEEFGGPESWQWLKRGSLKGETENLLAAAQDQALLLSKYQLTEMQQRCEKGGCGGTMDNLLID